MSRSVLAGHDEHAVGEHQNFDWWIDIIRALAEQEASDETLAAESFAQLLRRVGVGFDAKGERAA
ncbi:MAG: hypothetical protein ACXVBB_17435 [Isosphaeraceae bacterium]